MWNEENRHKTVLWIDGGPGCGKSVLSAFLSKVVIHSGSNRLSMPVAYFFCDDKDERLKTANAVLTNWLSQLLIQVPGSIVHFLKESTEKDKTSWTFGMLWRVLQRIIEDADTGEICLLVDALGMSSCLMCWFNRCSSRDLNYPQAFN